MTSLHFPWKETFLGQHPSETVLLILRRHWITMLGHILHVVILSLIPWVIAGIVVYLEWQDYFVTGSWYAVIILVTSLYYLGLWLLYFHVFLDYRLDVWVVTDQRIVDVEQKGLFNRVVAELNIINVQDVTSEIHGQLGTFLDYGNIYVQTAGEQHRFVFTQVPHPQAVARLVMQAHEAAMQQSPDPKKSVV